MTDKPAVSHWAGRPLTDLTREELIEAVERLGRDLSRQRAIPKDYRQMVRDKALEWAKKRKEAKEWKP